MKMTRKTTTIIGALLALAVIFSASSTSASPGTPTPFREVSSLADNGYKYPLVADSVTSSLYQEWWYFEVTDESQDLFFTCWYEIDNPAGETMNGTEIPRASYVGSEGFYGDYRFVWPMLSMDYGEYSAAIDTWSVNIAGSTITAIDMNTVEIIGTDLVTGNSWDLTFTRDTITGTYTDTAPTGYFPNDFMGWTCFMPRADVAGTIVINDQVINVNVQDTGYSDHNWGSPEVLSYAPWAKLVTNDGAIIGGGVPSMTAQKRNSNGFINAWVKNQWVWFHVPTITYTWAVDPITGGQFISNFHILATSVDNKWHMNLNIDLVGQYSFDLFDFGPYYVSFFKSFEFQTTGSIHNVIPGGSVIQISGMTTIEENFFIPKA